MSICDITALEGDHDHSDDIAIENECLAMQTKCKEVFTE